MKLLAPKKITSPNMRGHKKLFAWRRGSKSQRKSPGSGTAANHIAAAVEQRDGGETTTEAAVEKRVESEPAAAVERRASNPQSENSAGSSSNDALEAALTTRRAVKQTPMETKETVVATIQEGGNIHQVTIDEAVTTFVAADDSSSLFVFTTGAEHHERAADLESDVRDNDAIAPCTSTLYRHVQPQQHRSQSPYLSPSALHEVVQDRLGELCLAGERICFPKAEDFVADLEADLLADLEEGNDGNSALAMTSWAIEKETQLSKMMTDMNLNFSF